MRARFCVRNEHEKLEREESGRERKKGTRWRGGKEKEGVNSTKGEKLEGNGKEKEKSSFRRQGGFFVGKERKTSHTGGEEGVGMDDGRSTAAALEEEN